MSKTENHASRSSGANLASLDEAELIQRALAGDGRAFQTIMQTFNRRLYRIARSILGNESDAEDAVQEAYIQAFTHLNDFRAESRLSTWLSRITINQALGRLRTRRSTVDLETYEASQVEADIIQFPSTTRVDPERTMAQRELLRLVEQAADKLPDAFRIVFVARVVEAMSVDETAELLGLRPETVKTRLHRARRLLQEQLEKQVGPVLTEAFPFAGERCERLSRLVMQRLGFSA